MEKESSSRPIELSDQQVEALKTGTSTDIGEQSAPRDIDEKSVKMLADGKDLKIEDFSPLNASTAVERREMATTETRPRELTDDEIESLGKGDRDIDLSKKDALRDQY